MTVDILILSFAKTEQLWKLTQSTVDSCLQSEKEIDFNILVLEQNTNISYERCKTHYITEAFNYNRFMNIGISLTGGEYVCLCNNDLIFGKGWCSNIIRAMQENKLLSASPLCPRVQGERIKYGPAVDFGYNNSHHMSGWCIMCNRKLFKIIGEIDDEFPFWFADNIYSEQLKKHKVKHALVRSSVVTHIGSSTLRSISKQLHDEYTSGYIRKFVERHPQNESAKYFKQFITAVRPRQ